jgi:hypothetical protein
MVRSTRSRVAHRLDLLLLLCSCRGRGSGLGAGTKVTSALSNGVRGSGAIRIGGAPLSSSATGNGVTDIRHGRFGNFSSTIYSRAYRYTRSRAIQKGGDGRLPKACGRDPDADLCTDDVNA